MGQENTFKFCTERNRRITILLAVLLTLLLRKGNVKNKINQKSKVLDSGKQGTPKRMDSHDRKS